MKKRTTVLLTAFLISAILVSCGAFNADPVIDSFTASATTINVGDSVWSSPDIIDKKLSHK